MEQPAAESVRSCSPETNDDTRAASAPVPNNETDPLLTAEERNDRVLSKRASDGQNGSREEDAHRLHWPVRHFSASSDPVTRERRIRRLGTFIDKAKERGPAHREPLRRPSEGGSIRRVRTAPTPVRRRSSTTVSNLLWLTRPRARDSSAESLLRRVGHHINHMKARSHPDGDSPGKTPSEESLGFRRRSAPEGPLHEPTPDSPDFGATSPMFGHRESHHRQHCLPPLRLCAYRRPSGLRQDPPSSQASTSPSSHASVKSARADTATTLADVQVFKVSSQREGDGSLSSSPTTPSSSIHVVESGHGAYEVIWDEPSLSDSKTSDEPSVIPSKAIGLDDAQRESSPTGLNRVNTKLEQWSFAARESSALDRSRSHPHFRPYVEVYQDDNEPQFDLEDDSNALFMAPPNSKLPTPGSSSWVSRRHSETEPEAGPSTTSSPGSDSLSSSPASERHQQRAFEEDDYLLMRRHSDQYEHLIVPTGYYSPRPNSPLNAVDRLKKQSRSASELSNMSDLSDNGAALLNNHRDSVTLMRQSYQNDSDAPVSAPWIKRDSVAIAKERIRKKHANEVGEALVEGVGIIKGVSAGRTAPLAIPRIQQIAFVGALSPIEDSSPPRGEGRARAQDRNIDELAGNV